VSLLAHWESAVRANLAYVWGVSYLLRFSLILAKVTSSMATVTISLPDSLKAFVEQKLATAGYGNVSEYFRSLLRDAQTREEEARLEALLVEGLATGGKAIPLTREFWDDLRTEAKDLAKKHQAKQKRRRPASRQR
jgi:antitoxin ParD1/3/4